MVNSVMLWVAHSNIFCLYLLELKFLCCWAFEVKTAFVPTVTCSILHLMWTWFNKTCSYSLHATAISMQCHIQQPENTTNAGGFHLNLQKAEVAVKWVPSCILFPVTIMSLSLHELQVFLWNFSYPVEQRHGYRREHNSHRSGKCLATHK